MTDARKTSKERSNHASCRGKYCGRTDAQGRRCKHVESKRCAGCVSWSGFEPGDVKGA